MKTVLDLIMGFSGMVLLVVGLLTKDVFMFVSGIYLMLALRLDSIESILKNGATLKIETPIRDNNISKSNYVSER